MKFISSFAFMCFLLIVQPSHGSITINRDEVFVTVSNVPASEKSIYLPISINSEEIDFEGVKLKDIFVRGYLVNIERDENKKILGLSFSSLHSRPLPNTLEAIIKLKFIRPANLNVKDYPKNVSFLIDASKALNKFSTRAKGGWAGFDNFRFVPENYRANSKTEINRRRKERDNLDNSFYIKSFGQPLIKTDRVGITNKNLKDAKEYDISPILSDLDIIIQTPSEGKYDKLYIPIFIDRENLIKTEILNNTLVSGFVLRIIDNQMIELSSANNTASIPNNIKIQAKLAFKQNDTSLPISLRLGDMLIEPAKVITGISAIINPSNVSIEENSFNLLKNLF